MSPQSPIQKSRYDDPENWTADGFPIPDWMTPTQLKFYHEMCREGRMSRPLSPHEYGYESGAKRLREKREELNAEMTAEREFGRNPKDIAGSKKPPISLVPYSALVMECRAMEYGARKYGARNWRQKNITASLYVDATLRHLLAWFDGEECDQESGITHLAHARATLGILLDAKAHGCLIDDRGVGKPKWHDTTHVGDGTELD